MCMKPCRCVLPEHHYKFCRSYCFLIRLLGGAGGADCSREPQGESDRAAGQHLLHPAGGAGEDPSGGAA